MSTDSESSDFPASFFFDFRFSIAHQNRFCRYVYKVNWGGQIAVVEFFEGCYHPDVLEKHEMRGKVRHEGEGPVASAVCTADG